MNILQIVPEMNVGGVETGTRDLARWLVRFGHRAVVVSRGGAQVAELEAAGVTHYALPVHEKSLVTMLRMVPELARIIRREHIDIVHARSRVPAWIAWAACRLTGTVFITTCHGYYSNPFFSRVMGWGKRVIVISNSIAQHMTRDFGVPAERIRLIPRSVDIERFTYVSPDRKRREGQFRVGMISRITPLKGHTYFIRGMAKLARSVPGLKVSIVGDAPSSKFGYKSELVRLTQRLGLSDAVEFTGTSSDIPSVLADLDLLVLATTTPEAFGRVIVEAQASGVPVVATRVGGVVDIIEDGWNGILVPAADDSAIAAAAMRVFCDPALGRTLARNAYHRVRQRFTLDLMAKETMRVYEDALGDKRILVTKFTTVGDAVLSTPAFRAIRSSFPGASISVLAGEASREVFGRCPYVDEVLLHRGGIVRQLRKRRFDMVIDLQNNRKSHLISFLSAAPHRYGYDNGKYAFLLNHTIRDEKPAIDPVAHQFRMLTLAGMRLEDPRLELWPGDEDRRYADELLASYGVGESQTLVGINIAASLKWETKNWPVYHIAQLCARLSAKDIRVVVTGMKKDLEDVMALMMMAPCSQIINACGKTDVNQLACLIKRCSVYISPDSAPLHIAASQGVPFVALFGPTDPRRHVPPASRYMVLRKDAGCAPCYSRSCASRRCMEAITPEEVENAVETLLRKEDAELDRYYCNG